MPKRHDPHEDAIIQFSRELARCMEGEKLKRRLDSMTLIAPPRLLGKVRAEMSSDLKRDVTNCIKKDLQKFLLNKLIHFLIPSGE